MIKTKYNEHWIAALNDYIDRIDGCRDNKELDKEYSTVIKEFEKVILELGGIVYESEDCND